MATLLPHVATALAISDADGTDGKNIIQGAVMSLFDSDGDAVVMFDDADGSNGSTTKQTDATGRVTVYVPAGEYEERTNNINPRIITVKDSATEIATFADLQLVKPRRVGQAFICQEYGNAKFIVQPAVYTPAFGDVTFANGLDGELDLSGDIQSDWFGIFPDGSDVSSDVENALIRCDGRQLNFNVGTYVCENPIFRAADTVQGIFSAGVRVKGKHPLLTIFDNQSGDALFTVDSATHTPGSYKASFAAHFKGIGITATTNKNDSIGIKIVNGYQVIIEDFYFRAMDYGILMANGAEIDDGWNMVNIRNGWIDGCRVWGIKADGSAGRNEGSYTKLEQVFFQTCGTDDGGLTPPTSGGMIWKGQIIELDQVAFANGCQNVGLFIKGESGLGQSVFMNGTTFENCYKRGLYCTGATQFKSINSQFYNNDNFVSTVQCEFDGTNHTIRNVNFESTTIRATSGNNPITAFKVGGANAELDTIEVNSTNWDNFDYAGQTRFEGFKNDPFVLATKNNAQSVFNSESAIIWDAATTDEQGALNTTTGRWTIPYVCVANFEGRITLTDVDAGAEVVISLYDVNNAVTVSSCNLAATGLTTESFDFDLYAKVGAVGTTRSYEIRVTQSSVGSKALDVSAGKNQLCVKTQKLKLQ